MKVLTLDIDIFPFPLHLLEVVPSTWNYESQREPCGGKDRQNPLTKLRPWVSCKPLAFISYLTDSDTFRALGTPLAWPEAKRAADQVREWGIEVCAKGRITHESDLTNGLATLDDLG